MNDNKKIIKSNTYQNEAISFRKEECDNLSYPLLGLIEETGELIDKTRLEYEFTLNGFYSWILLHIVCICAHFCGKIAKKIRKGKISPTFFPLFPSIYEIEECRKELGDIHWMVVNLDDQYNATTSQINNINIDKLTKRRNEGTIITHKDH